MGDGTQIYHNGEMIHGYAMDELQSDGMIGNLLQKNKENEFVVSTGKKLLCSAGEIDEKWRTSRDFTEPLKSSVYKIAAIMKSYEEAKELIPFWEKAYWERICFVNILMYLMLVVLNL